MKKKQIKNNTILFLVALIFVILNSFETINHCNNDDSIIFNTIGKFWNEGKIPYIDLFDHKGPLIFFINMLGWKFFQCEQGVLVFQVLALFFTSICLFKIAQLQIQNDKKSLLFVILTVLFLGFTYSGGNLTEEYCLPFITLCLYFNLRYLKNYTTTRISEPNLKEIFWYGFSFAVCFLTRITNAISICIGIWMIGIILLKEKKFQNIFESIFVFALGFFVIFLPFAVYFAKQNAFYEFIEGTILFNFQYAINSIHWLKQGNLVKNIAKCLIIYFPSCLILIVGMLKLRKEKNIIGVFYILLGISETILFMKSRLYIHYAIIGLPNILLALLELEKCKISKKYQRIVYVLMVMLCLTAWMGKMYQFKNKNIPYVLYDQLMAQIPDEEKESFIAVDVRNFQGIYEHYQICPYYKYFVLQDFQASNSSKLCNKMYDEFKNGDVKWILFGGNIEKTLIKEILEEKYDIIEKEERMNVILYRVRE